MDGNVMNSNHARTEARLYDYEIGKDPMARNYLKYLDAITTTIDLEKTFNIYSYITAHANDSMSIVLLHVMNEEVRRHLGNK